MPGSWGRRKRWDFWGITAPGIAVNLTFADVDYLGLTDVWFHDFERDRTATSTRVSPFGRGMGMPARAGEADLRGKGLSLVDGPDGTRLRARFRTKTGPFELDVLAGIPDGHESLTVVIPWSERRFQCTTKDVGRPATGRIRWGDDEYVLDDDAWACLDFGRGKWPYRITWNWGAAAGHVGDRTVGLQLGGKWTDGTGMTENAVVVDGRLSKLSEDLAWDYDREDWLKPWRIRTPRSDRVDLTFTPAYDKVSRLQAGIAASSVDQCFGTYSGSVVADDGQSLEVKELFGWAEEATWRW